MIVWILYDISDDKKRNRAAKYCKNKGLYRVQKSIFLGNINKNDKDELKIMFERLIDMDTDSIYIFPSDKDLIYETDLIGKGFDREMICDEVISKFI